MRKIALMILMIAMLAMSATALKVGSPTLGDDNQDRVAGVDTTFTVTNDDLLNKVTSLTLTFGAGAEASKYALQVTNLPSELDPGQSVSVRVNGTIPLDHDGVDSDDLKEKALKIGTVTVSGTANGSQVSNSADVMMQAVNQFRIQRARVDCGSKSETVDDGDNVENLKPGDQCTLEVEVENEFDDDDRDNKKIGDIDFTSITVRLDSSDNDVDIDEDSDLDDLDANDEDTFTADIDIDEDANDGNIQIEIRISARDENGALHGEELNFDLEVDRLTHDLQIRNIDMNPTRVSACDASTSKVTVSILNQGKRDEDEAAVEVSIPELGFQDKITNIELDENDRTTVEFRIPVEEGTDEGVYRVDVTTFFDTLAQSNTASIELTVDECQEEEEEVPEETGNQQTGQQNTVVVPQTQPVQPAPGQALAAPKNESFTDSKAYVALLAVLIVLILIGIGFMVHMLMRKRQQF